MMFMHVNGTANVADLVNRSMTHVCQEDYERSLCDNIKSILDKMLPPGEKCHATLRFKGDKNEENDKTGKLSAFQTAPPWRK